MYVHVHSLICSLVVLHCTPSEQPCHCGVSCGTLRISTQVRFASLSFKQRIPCRNVHRISHMEETGKKLCHSVLEWKTKPVKL